MDSNNIAAYTGFIRNALISQPVEDGAIQPGMGLLYAQPYAPGIIKVQLGQVIGSFDMPEYKCFKCTRITGEDGFTEFSLNQRLEVTHAGLPRTGTISNSERSIDSDDKFNVRFENGIFIFEFNNEYLEDVEIAERGHVLSGPGYVIMSEVDPRRARMVPPGSALTKDKNTLEFIVASGTKNAGGQIDERSMWRVVQRIPDGPEGFFDQLGFRVYDVEELKRILEEF